MLRNNVNLSNPEEVKLFIARNKNWSNGHKTLYRQAKVGFTSCLALNDQLNNRHAHPKRTENWLKRFIPMYMKRFLKVKKSLEKVLFELKEKKEYFVN